MKCPVCKSQEFQRLQLHADGFDEQICECSSCSTSWSVNHGLSEVIRDSQKNSFLEAIAECVDGDDYAWAV